METALFDYHLDAAAIAQQPIEPRHDARLLDTRTMTDHRFLEIGQLLTPGDLVVVNTARVRRARLYGMREPTGGAVEALVLQPGGGGTWQALVRPSRRIHCGSTLRFGDVTATVLGEPVAGEVTLVFAHPDPEGFFSEYGELPLPPYFHGELADPDRYQTMFARAPIAAAAPTAGLHFTPEVVAGLRSSLIEIASVDLAVGIGTFRPIAASDVESHRMHTEWFSVPAATVEAVRRVHRRGGRVVAVGTTVVRALESAAREGSLASKDGVTDLYLIPGSKFRVVDLLVTNF
ncbi:MAG: S-adenosylmethionine:tRNA ribosyltransferase-isomerase, partial [Acidimicrobiia bacterium]